MAFEGKATMFSIRVITEATQVLEENDATPQQMDQKNHTTKKTSEKNLPVTLKTEPFSFSQKKLHWRGGHMA